VTVLEDDVGDAEPQCSRRAEWSETLMKRFQGVVERMECFSVSVQSRSQCAQRVHVATGVQLRHLRLQFGSLRRESVSLLA
jgi:hypothetical protein